MIWCRCPNFPIYTQVGKECFFSARIHFLWVFYIVKKNILFDPNQNNVQYLFKLCAKVDVLNIEFC